MTGRGGRAVAIVAAFGLLAAGDGAAAQDTAGIPGFAAGNVPRQRDLEAAFLAVPSAERARATARWLAAAPHMAGTPAQAALADSLAGRLRRLGFDVEVERFDVYLPHPDTLALELVGPPPLSFDLRERSAVDPAADDEGDLGGKADPHAWTWNAYSASGTARGPVVYANYGTAADYDALREQGVVADGAIVLVRYGGVYRGTKVREAEKRGAAGVVLYPDPADGGFASGDTVPFGPYRPTASVQRGTVSYMWRYTGDPLTPGRPSLPGVPRLDPAAAPALPGIPVLNITAEQAREVLARLDGPEAPERFRGGWPLPYRVGPGPAELRMTVRLDGRQRPVRNVIARLPGREDDAVIVGVHFDAWVRGGVDPHSGTGAVLEIARGLAALRERGWQPRRDIVLAFWGGEEFGVVGSTEHVEARRAWLAEHAVAYLNVDVFTAGDLDVSGSFSLRDLVWSAARDVRDPGGAGTLADGWVLRPLGLGSDWTAFFHFAGVPSLQWTMNGRGTYAVYHSALDDFDYLTTHADPGLLATPAMASVMGLAALRLAEADALPFDYGRYARRLRTALDEIPGGAAVRDALAGMEAAAAEVEVARDVALETGDTAFLRHLNRTLPRVEAALLRPEAPRGADALPGVAVDRWSASWYRHLVLGPDPATGYGTILLPGLRPAAATGPRHRDPALEAGLRRATRLLREAARR